MAGRKAPIYLEDVADRALRLVNGTLDDLEKLRMQQRKDRREAADGRHEIDLAGINALDKTTRALTGLLKEIRALERNAKESAGKLGPTQRQELLKDYFAKQPEVNQYSLLLDLKQIYDDRRVVSFEKGDKSSGQLQ